MKIIKSHIVLIMLSMFFCSNSFAQAEKVQFTKLNRSEGAPQSTVLHITEDNIGYIWISTRAGLFQYDGKNFIHFTSDSEDSTTISNNWVYKFYESKNGACYVATNLGFNQFDKEKGVFKRYLYNNEDTTSLSNNDVHDISETANGDIILATATGIDIFNPTTEKFDRIKHSKFGFNSNTPSLLIDEENQIWAGSNSGLFLLEEASDTLQYFPLINQKGNRVAISALTQNSSDKLWLATTNGVYLFHIDEKRFEHIPISPEHTNTNIQDLILVPDNHLYLATKEGLFYWGIEDQKLEKHYQYSKDNPDGISVSWVYSLLLDRHNNIWLGLYRGINIFNPEREKFKVYLNQPGIDNLENQILKIIKGSKGDVWTASMTGLHYKEHLDSFSQTITYPTKYQSRYWSIRDFEEDSNGEIWVAITMEGLYKSDRSQPTINLVEDQSFFKYRNLNDIVRDKNSENAFWIGTTGGICHYNTITRDTFWIYPSNYLTDTTIQQSDYVYALQQHDDGTIYFINFETLSAYYPKQEKVDFFQYEDVDSTGWTPGNAYSMDIINDKIYFSGYEINPFDLREQSFVNIAANKLNDINVISSLLGDKDENIWIGWSELLLKWNPRLDSINSFNVGNHAGSFVVNAQYRAHDDKLYFGTSNGLLEVAPNNILIDTIKDEIVLSKFYVSNQEKIFNGSIESIDEIFLKHNENDFTLEFTALNFTNQNNISYQYKLVGFDDDWKDSRGKREITYTNIPPRQYTFLVKSFNTDGIKSANTLNIDIKISPPFWKTNWFYSLLILLFLLIGYVVFKEWKKTQQLKQSKFLADQKSFYKSQFLANMSHELRTPMNAIMGLNDLMLSSPLNEKQAEYSEAISLSCGHLLGIINDVLDQAKIESGKLEIKKESFVLHDVILQVEQLLKNKIQQKGLKFELEYASDIPKYLVGDAVRIYQILTNLIGNAIKFTNKGTINLSVSKVGFEENQVQILFKVKDTGIGIPKDKLDLIFKSFEQVKQTNQQFEISNQGTGLGLSIVKNLVKLLEGEIKVISEINKGSEFSFSVPFGIGNSESAKPIETIGVLNRKLRILLVEDTPMNQFVATELLKKHLENPTIEKAKNGEEAILKIKTTTYDLVLMDIKMPVMDGLEATRLIRKIDGKYYKEVPIIGLTANAIQQQIDACFEAGMNECVTKPIIINELLTKIQTELNN